MWQLFHKFCGRMSPSGPTWTWNLHAQLLFPECGNLAQNHLFVHGRGLAGASNFHIGPGMAFIGNSQTGSSRGIFFGRSGSGSNVALLGGSPTGGVAFSSTQVSDPWQQRASYKWFLPVQTRWKDNDQYGHVNNAVYHAIFDSVINVYLIRKSGLDPTSPSVPRGYMLSNSCRFTSSARYPQVYLAGVGVSHIGNSSVRYQLGLFPKIDDNSGLLCDLVQGHWAEDEQVLEFGETSIVTGEYIHVFVSPDTGKACPIPDQWRPQLQQLMVNSQD